MESSSFITASAVVSIFIKPTSNLELASAPKTAKDQLKREKEEFKKDSFPYMKVAQYGAVGYKEDFFRVRRQNQEQWKDVYGCLFLEYFLVYENGDSKVSNSLILNINRLSYRDCL